MPGVPGAAAPGALLFGQDQRAFGFAGVTARPIRPVSLGKPFPHFFQVAPPSLLLQIPPPSAPFVATGP